MGVVMYKVDSWVWSCRRWIHGCGHVEGGHMGVVMYKVDYTIHTYTCTNIRIIDMYTHGVYTLHKVVYVLQGVDVQYSTQTLTSSHCLASAFH